MRQSIQDLVEDLEDRWPAEAVHRPFNMEVMLKSVRVSAGMGLFDVHDDGVIFIDNEEAMDSEFWALGPVVGRA